MQQQQYLRHLKSTFFLLRTNNSSFIIKNILFMSVSIVYSLNFKDLFNVKLERFLFFFFERPRPHTNPPSHDREGLVPIT